MTHKNKDKAHIVIIGGGFAGLTALHNLQHILGNHAAITLIDANSNSVNRPTMPEVAFTGKPASHTLFPLNHAVNSRNSIFHQGRVKKIEPELNQVLLEDGNSLNYDYLLVAPGAVHDYDAVEGLDEFGYSVCDEVHASHLWEALQNFKGGNIVIGSAPTKQGTRVKAPILKAACEGPIGEAMFMLDFFMKKHHLRDKSTIKIFSPAEIFFEDVGPKVHKAFEPLFEEAGISVATNKEISRVYADHVEFSDGSQWESDFTIVLPPHAAPDFIRDSGLGDEAGWMPTDNSMQHLDHGNIFAAGDCNALSQPKLGHIAAMQGKIAASKIALELGEKVEVPEFNPEVFCIMNRGGHEATLILTDTLYGGTRDIVTSGALPHLMKWSFDNYVGYTHGHLPPEWSEDIMKKLLEHL